MRMHYVAATCAALIAGAPALAASWVLVTNSRDGIRVEIDTSSVARTKDEATAWFRFNYPVDATGSTSSRQLLLFDCGTREEVMMAFTTYAPTGKVIDTYNIPRSDAVSRMEAVTPNSLGEQMLRTACGTD